MQSLQIITFILERICGHFLKCCLGLQLSAVVEEQAWYYPEQFINVSFLWTWLLGNVKQSHPTFFVELETFSWIDVLPRISICTRPGSTSHVSNTWYCVFLGGEIWKILTSPVPPSPASDTWYPGVCKTTAECGFLSPLLLQLFPSW